MPNEGATSGETLSVDRIARGLRICGMPKHGGMGLGARLGLLVTLVVSGVMATISGAELAWELRSEVRNRQSFLAASLAPLAAQLQAATEPGELGDAIARFHASHLARGNPQHYVAVVHEDGKVVLQAGEKVSAEIPQVLTASASIAAPALGPERLRLVIVQEDARFAADQSRRWRAWGIHVVLTALLIAILLYFVIRREITRPIGRLLRGIRKMELGYWDDMPDPGGAWELRWLGWRFRAMARELSATVEHLIAAQRRAYSAAAAAPTRDAPGETVAGTGACGDVAGSQASGALDALHETLRHLHEADSRDAQAQALARITWETEARRAELMGHPHLRICLEDAALRVLEPDEFARTSEQVEAQRQKLEETARKRSRQINEALGSRGVPLFSMSHRIKHVAGVWKKMKEKDLAFDQVHDLVALRIVVLTEADCYLALGVVHDLYTPMIGRFKDYVARPKPNGYRSLHTSVHAADGRVFEVQIRSVAMHRVAEQGDAAHADYNAAKSASGPRSQDGQWLA